MTPRPPVPPQRMCTCSPLIAALRSIDCCTAPWAGAPPPPPSVVRSPPPSPPSSALFSTTRCSSHGGCGSLRGDMELRGGDRCSCDGAAGRRLSFCGSGRPPARLPAARAAQCRRLRLVDMLVDCAAALVSRPEKSAALQRVYEYASISRLRERVWHAHALLKTPNSALSNDIGVVGVPVKSYRSTEWVSRVSTSILFLYQRHDSAGTGGHHSPHETSSV